MADDEAPAAAAAEEVAEMSVLDALKEVSVQNRWHDK